MTNASGLLKPTWLEEQKCGLFFLYPENLFSVYSGDELP